MIRVGAIIFGVGTVGFHILELITVLELPPDDICHNPVRAAFLISNIIMVVLEAYLIFMFPRLNLRINPPIDRLGTMHLFAVNIIMWIR